RCCLRGRRWTGGGAPRRDAEDVALDHRPEVDERLESSPAEHESPGCEVGEHPRFGGVAPGVVELLLEHVGAVEALVEPEQRVKIATPSPVQVPPLVE